MRTFIQSVLLIALYPIALICAVPPAAIAAAPAEDAKCDAGPRQPIVIGFRSRNPAIELAGAELAKYLGMMAGDAGAATVAADPVSVNFVADPSETPAELELGLLGDFGVVVDGVDDAELDDAIYIDVRDSKGVIAGSNPRSVLFAAYRFLEASGCRWLRPGPDGDYVPSRRIDNISVQINDKARYRFRGHNNSGSYGIDYILSKIEWGAKVGLNTFYNEFFIPQKSYQSWYGREYPSPKAPAPRTDAEITAYHQLLNREVKRRGLLLHAVGHGWNARLFGCPEIESHHWGKLEVPESQAHFLSLVDGERVKRGPTVTELCYGNDEVRHRLVHLVADYAEAHPEVDYLHFWLDDRMNNTCECPLCRHKRVSDFYLMMLNAIDRELTRRDLPTRIVFLIYQDTLWPPEEERFLNQDRFVLMFAPISRLFDEPYAIPDGDVAVPPYQLNKNASPQDIERNVAFLQAWQQAFQGPGFVYDYHMFYIHFHDQGYYGYVDVLAEDIRRLPRLNLDGFVSCQMQRSFYPHGFPHHVHAGLLWNPARELDDLAQSYFQGAFGTDGALVLEYVQTLSDLFNPKHFYRLGRARDDRPGEEAIQDARKKLSMVQDAAERFRPVIERNLSADDPAQARSWKHLSIHSGMAVLMADALLARDEGRKADEQAAWKAMRDYVVEHEEATEGVFDVFSFRRIFPAMQ